MMHSQKWEIINQDSLGSLSTKVWLIYRGGAVPELARIDNGRLVLEKIESDGEEKDPTLNIPFDVWQALKEAMVDGVEKDKNEVEAELTATKYHLEDLRRLLKLT